MRLCYSEPLLSKFIGLAVRDSLIACGSEDNNLVLYHEALSKPVFSYKFPDSRFEILTILCASAPL